MTNKKPDRQYQAIKPYLVLVITFLLMTSSRTITAQTVKIKILETSDVHGALFEYDFRDNKPAPSSLSRFSSYLKLQRSELGENVITLDNGDILQGQPVVYYYNFEKTGEPHIVARVLNYLKYDAATIGNHDIEAGHPVYDRISKQYSFPLLAANAVDRKTGRPYFQPYKVLERKGVKIAVLGLITPAIPNWLPEKIWEGIEFEDMVASAEKWISIIKKKEKPDVIVGLFHSGVEYTYNNQKADDLKNENASLLVAQRVQGFDVVFTGHDHKIWNMNVKAPGGSDVLVLGPQSDARSCAVATIELKKKNGKWIKSVSGEVVNLTGYASDREFDSEFGRAVEEVKQYVSKPIGSFSEPVSVRPAFFGPSVFMSLIHRIQLELTGADVSFSAPLSFDTEIKEGTIRVSDMFKLYKYENLLYTMEMSGREIKDYLEYSYDGWFDRMNSSEDHLIRFRRDSSGNVVYARNESSPQLAVQYYNFCSAAGINYTVDVSQTKGSRVTILSMSNGRPFEMDKKYRAAVNSYRGNGGGGHLTEGAGIAKDELPKRVITSTEKDLRYFMMKWIEDKKEVKVWTDSNWRVLPEDWYSAAKERDYNLLYKSRK